MNGEPRPLVYGRTDEPLAAEICAENNQQFDYHMPVAEQPDFCTAAMSRCDAQGRVESIAGIFRIAIACAAWR